MPSGELSRIRTNIGALNALHALENINSQLMATNLRLATGKRINSAGDDPSGLSLANTLDLRARMVASAEQNVGDAENVLSIVEGGLSNINELLGHMMEKLVLAGNDTQGVSERNAIMGEINQLGLEIDSIVTQTQFNGVVLLTVNTLTFQVGPGGGDTNVYALAQSFNSGALAVGTLTVATQTLASASLGTVQAAINQVRTALQNAGSSIERLRVRSENLGVAQINLRAAQSRIMDADLASEQLNSSKLTILQQTATAQLAAANTAPASILALFR